MRKIKSWFIATVILSTLFWSDIAASAQPGPGPTPSTSISSVSSNWTATDLSGGSLTLTTTVGKWVQIGPIVYIWGTITFPVTIDVNPAVIGGLPVSFQNLNTGASGQFYISDYSLSLIQGAPVANSSKFSIVSATGSSVLNSTMTNTTIRFQFSYPAQ